MTLHALGVLVDGDHFRIGQDRQRVRRHRGEVVPGEERRGQDAPQAHVGQVLVVAHLAVPDFEHVGIVPVAGAGVFFEAVLVEADDGHSVVPVADVARRAPQVAPDRRSPLPHALEAVLAQAVNDGPPRARQGVVHLLVRGLHLGGLIDPRSAAPIVLQVIDAPVGVLLGVLFLVAVAPFVFGAGLRSRRRVDTQLQSLAVDVVGQRLHVRELLVRLNHAARVALPLPAVVDVDVDVARVLHAV